MNRRSFMKSAGALIVATAAVQILPKKETPPRYYHSDYNRAKREAMQRHMLQMEASIIYGVPIETYKTPFGTVTQKAIKERATYVNSLP